MTILVDFNDHDDEGRLIALFEDLGVDSPRPGGFVVAADREGNQCKARVDEVSKARAEIDASWRTLAPALSRRTEVAAAVSDYDPMFQAASPPGSGE